MSKRLWIMVSVAAILLTVGQAWAKELRFGHVGPAFHGQHLGAMAMAKYVEEKTGGAVKINVFPMGQLGGEVSLADQVQSGTLDIASVSTAILQNYVPQCALVDLPFIYPNRQTAYAVLDDREFQDKLFSFFPAKGFVAVGYTENEFRDVTNSKRPIRKPEDLKGLKIRVMESPVLLDTFKQFGASPVPMSFPEIYNALQQGVIDAQENPAYTSILMKFTEVNKHLTLTKHSLTECIIIVTPEVWKGLSPREQQIFRDGAAACIKTNREVSAAHVSKMPKIEKSMDDILKDQKVEVVTLTDQERAAFVDAVKPVWDKYRQFCGPDFYDFFVKKIKALTK